jgi:hypothetical protein
LQRQFPENAQQPPKNPSKDLFAVNKKIRIVRSASSIVGPVQVGSEFFYRAPLHCVPAAKIGCWEQLRASLRQSGITIFFAYPALAPSARPSAPRAVLGYLMSRLAALHFSSHWVVVAQV